MTTAQEEAMAQVATLAAAIRRLGGAATAVALSEETGLTLAGVSRRLTQNGTSNLRAECRYFRRTSEGWLLTDRGLALLPDPAA